MKPVVLAGGTGSRLWPKSSKTVFVAYIQQHDASRYGHST